jgi:aldehyde dehydrogenase (NAD+)
MERPSEIYVGGKWAPSTSDRAILVHSPSTEEQVGQVPDASLADVNAAVTAARTAFDEGPWPQMSPADRAQVMQALLSELRTRADELANVITTENGTPVMLARQAHVNGALDTLSYYAEVAAEMQVESHRAGRYTPALVRHEPVGTVAAIVPWNVPLLLSMMKVAPALATGCTTVLKAAPETPLNANILAEAADTVGLPDGVLNVIAAGPESSEALVTHAGIDKIAFTGSTAVGRRIASLAAAQLKRVTLELGGKSAAIVLDDADLESTMPQLIGVTMALSGQFCAAQSRVLVPRERYDDAIAIYASVVGQLAIGDPFDGSTFFGPLISQRQRDRVLRYIDIGRQEGAVVVTGGGTPAALKRGWYVEPTIFRDVSNRMRIAQEEIFGPVVAFIRYDNVDDAVAMANDSIYGLHGSVWTNDVERGVAVGRRIRTGTYTVNGLALDPAVPFGGMKNSGLGREMGPEGLGAYLEPRTITVPSGTTLSGSV